MPAIDIRRRPGRGASLFVRIPEMFGNEESAPINSNKGARLWARTLLLGHRELIRLGRQILKEAADVGRD